MLVWQGQAQTWGVVDWVLVCLSFLVIYVVPGFYMKLAAEVIAELIKSDQCRFMSIVWKSKSTEYWQARFTAAESQRRSNAADSAD
jgi:hypothetical protein